MRTLLQFAVVLALAYGVLLGCTYRYQSRLIYFPGMGPTDPTMTPARLGLRFDDVRFTAADGVGLHGWYIPAEPERGVLLFMHGNAGDITHRLDSIAVFHRQELSQFIFDYRGFGQSDGSPDESGTYADAMAAWQYLIDERGIPANDIVIFGRSLGAAIATQLATQTQPAALIIESAFTSAPDVAADHYWFLPVRMLSRFDYDTRAHLEHVEVPVLIIHSVDDEIIPVKHGEALYAVAADPKAYLELRGDHNQGFLLSEPAYSAGLDAFLSDYLATRGYRE